MRHLSRVSRRLHLARERRPQPRWLRPMATAGAVLGALLIATGGLAYTVTSGVLPALAEQTRARLIDLSAEAGLVVAEVDAEGRRYTSPESVLTILALRVGQPILGVDAEAMKARLEGLPWVRSASVARELPDRIVIRLDERRPLALWQEDGRHRLIDREGAVIEGDPAREFHDLPVLVGEEAPARAGELFALLATEPELMRRVTAAVLVGGRRWDVRLDHELVAQLPEHDAERAWRLLAEQAREHGLLERAVRVIDLREADRMILRLDPELVPARALGVGA